jgi:hypothetical protein
MALMASNDSLECGLHGQSYRQLNYHFTLYIQHRYWHHLQGPFTYLFLFQSSIRQMRVLQGYPKALCELDKEYTQGKARLCKYVLSKPVRGNI